jgi:glycosyltransferase 2 family protein
MSAQASFRQRAAARVRAGLRRSRALYTPVAILCIAALVFSEHLAFYDGFLAISPGLLLLTFLCVGLGHLCIAVASHRFFRAVGARPGFGLVLATHLNRLPARYIPGGVWQTVSRSLDFSAAGVEAKSILRLVLLEIGVALGLALLMGGLCLWVASPDALGGFSLLLAAAGLAGLLALPVAEALLSPMSRVDMAAFGAGIAVFVPVWLLYASAFSLFLAHLGVSLGWATDVGIYLVSWSAGFLAFFAPQGIGVFELTAGYLATDSVSAAIIAALFVFRLILIAADLATYALYRLTRFGMHLMHRNRI